MMPDGLVGSDGAGMLDAVPQDAFETAETELAADGVDESSIEEPADEPEAVEEPEAEAEPEVEAQPEQTEEFPEGVRKGKDRHGKDGYWLNEQRYGTFHEAHKTLQKFSEVAGEPITLDAFKVYQRAFTGQERFFTDFASGEIGTQGKVANALFDEAARAVTDGEVAGNPMIPFTQAYYNTLKQRDPQAYDALSSMAGKDLVERLYAAAASSQNKNLFLSLGHIADALKIPYKTEADMPAFFESKGALDPMAQLRAENQKLQDQLTGRQSNNQAAQFDTWKANTAQTVSGGILNDAVTPAVSQLATMEGSYWKTHPDAFKHHVIDRLHSEVRNVIRQDAGFNQRVADLDKLASRAVSAQKRADIAKQIEGLFVSRAKIAIGDGPGSMKARICKDATDWAGAQSKSRHERQQASQGVKGVNGTGSPVPKSLVPPVPKSNGIFNPDVEARRLQALLQ